jgi:hypothetical protein
MYPLAGICASPLHYLFHQFQLQNLATLLFPQWVYFNHILGSGRGGGAKLVRFDHDGMAEDTNRENKQIFRIATFY